MNMMTRMLLLLLLINQATAIKFAADGVTVPNGVLRVSENTEISCKYIMWKQERLASVTWSIMYPGVKTDFFVYRANGNKEVKPGVSLVSVDADSSGDKEVTMQLTDGRERDVSFCCHVMVLRDDGYGSMTTREKEKCSQPIRVEASQRRQQRISVSLESPETGKVGDTLQLVCAGQELTSYHRLKLTVNGVETAVRDSRYRRLEYSLTLHESHFIPTRLGSGPQGQTTVGTVTIECLVMQGRTVAANSTRVIRQEEENTGGSPIGNRIGVERGARAFYTAEEAHRTHPANVPCQAYLLVQQRTGGGAVLLGRLTDSLLEDIATLSRTAEDRHETEITPVDLLNVLGFHGHRVVGVSTNPQNQMVWTLERKYYEFHEP